MNFWKRLAAYRRPQTAPLVARPLCVQDGALRAYIWPVDRQFGYEVVNASGEKLSVGAEPDFTGARDRALRLMHHWQHGF